MCFTKISYLLVICLLLCSWVTVEIEGQDSPSHSDHEGTPTGTGTDGSTTPPGYSSIPIDTVAPATGRPTDTPPNPGPPATPGTPASSLGQLPEPWVTDDGTVIEYDSADNQLCISCGAITRSYEADWADLVPDLVTDPPTGECTPDGSVYVQVVSSIVDHTASNGYVRVAGCRVIIRYVSKLALTKRTWECTAGRWIRGARSVETVYAYRDTRVNCCNFTP